MSRVNPEFETANIRFGKIFLQTAGALTEAFEAGQPLTIPDIRDRIPTPTSGVRMAVFRMKGLFTAISDVDFCPIIESGDHPSLTWQKADVEKPVKTYRFTEYGNTWSTSLLVDLAIAGGRVDLISKTKHQLYTKVAE